jgi:hypothetical protein
MKKTFSILAALILTNISTGQTGGIKFDYTSETYIVTPDNAAIDLINDFTIEMWLQPTETDTVQCLLQKGTCNDYSYAYSVQLREDSTLLFSFNSDGSCTYSNSWKTTTQIVPGQCVHVAITYAAPGPAIYFDGVLQPGVYFAGTYSGDLINSVKPLETGIYTSISGNKLLAYNGKMDELHIWSKVLTPAEIIANMTGPLTGTETDLELYYDFDSFVAGDNAVITNMASTGAGLNGTVSSLNSTSPAPASGACFTSISEQPAEANFRVYPNPSAGEVYFHFNTASPSDGDLTLIIRDLNGRVVMEQKMSASSYTLDSKCFANGTYQYTITSGDYEVISTGTLVFN